jgi:hypothetical protein
MQVTGAYSISGGDGKIPKGINFTKSVWEMKKYKIGILLSKNP